MKRIRLVLRAAARAVKRGIWLIRDSASDVAELYPEHQARGENAATHGSAFASMMGVGHPSSGLPALGGRVVARWRLDL